MAAQLYNNSDISGSICQKKFNFDNWYVLVATNLFFTKILCIFILRLYI
jgi:hypothetical protein